MRTDVGLLDRLFGERTMIELPGPDGLLRRVSVTVKWLKRMEREGKMERAAELRVQVHVLDPGGPARAELGLSGSAKEYYVTSWVVGVDVPEETVARLLDRDTQALYAVTVYESGRSKTSVMQRRLWDDLRRTLDTM